MNMLKLCCNILPNENMITLYIYLYIYLYLPKYFNPLCIRLNINGKLPINYLN